MWCGLVISGVELPLDTAEMVEILTAIRDTPIHGNECFSSAREKACAILREAFANDRKSRFALPDEY